MGGGTGPVFRTRTWFPSRGSMLTSPTILFIVRECTHVREGLQRATWYGTWVHRVRVCAGSALRRPPRGQRPARHVRNAMTPLLPTHPRHKRCPFLFSLLLFKLLSRRARTPTIKHKQKPATPMLAPDAVHCRLLLFSCVPPPSPTLAPHRAFFSMLAHVRPLLACLAAVGWVPRGYSGQYSGFQPVVFLHGLPIL